MEIHKPKPWRGSREFVKEIGAIVIGVLIALGAEQAVEWLHRQHEVAEAREALHEEMTRNATAMKLNIEEAPCVFERLDRVVSWANGDPPPIWDAGSLIGVNSNAWDEAKTSAVPHMPLKERIAFDNYYAGISSRQQVSWNERNALAVLSRYRGDSKVAPEDRERVREDVASARTQVAFLAAADRDLLQGAKVLGVAPRAYRPATLARLKQVCDPAGAPVDYGSREAQ